MSTKNRHSYVPFYTSDWLAGTARMPRMVKSVYFDICCYTWDTGRKVPDAEIVLMLADTQGQGDKIVDALVKSGKLLRDEDGNVWSRRALAEAEKAFELWQKKSRGGKKTGERRAEQQESSGTAPIEPEPEPEPEPEFKGGDSPPLAGEPKIDAAPPAGEKPAEGGGEDKPDAKPKRISAGACAEVFAAWNAVAKPLGLPVAVKMTSAREGSIRARIEELGNETIAEALALLPECRFLHGDNDRKWKADLDFFVRPNSIPRIIEGKFRTAGGAGSAWKDME